MGRAQGERQGEEEWLFEEGEANTGLMCLQGEGVEVWKDPAGIPTNTLQTMAKGVSL